MKTPTTPLQLHAQAANALQFARLELFSEPTRYAHVLRYLATAQEAVCALSLADVATRCPSDASNDAGRDCGALSFSVTHVASTQPTQGA